jgi:hypothetical protein
VIGWIIVPYIVDIGNPKWLPPQDLVFNIGPFRKMNKSFSFETTNMNEPNLCINGYEMAH